MKIRIIGILIILALSGCKSMVLSEAEEHYVLSQKGKEKYYLVKLIRKKQKEGILGEKPMMVFNGQPIYIFYKDFNGTPTTEKRYIKSVEILKGEEGSKIFGVAAKYGLVEVSNYGEQKRLP